jgi:transposase
LLHPKQINALHALQRQNHTFTVQVGYRFPARISREQLLRQESLAKPIRDTAWKAQERLCRRYRKLARAGKPPTVVTAAIARELSGFVWSIAKQVQPTGA